MVLGKDSSTMPMSSIMALIKRDQGIVHSVGTSRQILQMESGLDKVLGSKKLQCYENHLAD